MNTTPICNYPLCRLGAVVSALVLALLWASTASAQLYRPERARRSITTDHYELVLQKNSQIDLLTSEGQPLLDNAFPSLILEGGEEVPLKIDYRNTNRYSVDNPIGKGNGFHYVSEACEWRIATYPAERGLTFDLTYTNQSKKPVTVAGLSPLSLGNQGKGGVHLGGSASDVLVLLAPDPDNPFTRIGHTTGSSPGHIAAWSPATGKSLVAGFLTHRRSLGELKLGKSTASSEISFDSFSSVCIFYPPVVVGPGEQLQAETLYLSLGNQDPSFALEAFAQATQALEPYPAKANLHGWLPNAEASTSAGLLLDNLSAAKTRMLPVGWSNFNLGGHWSALPESMGVDLERVAQGLEPVIAAARGGGLSLTATTGHHNTDLKTIETNLKTLKESGIGSVEFIQTLSPNSTEIPSPHPLSVLQMVEESTMDLPRVVYTRPMAKGPFSLKDWALNSRTYYLPTIGNPLLAPWAREVAQDTQAFSDTQFIAAFTLAAIQGKPLRPATPWTDLSPLRQQVLARLLPAPAHAAHPLDLFQEGPPQRWSLPLRTKAGEWAIAAMFNWEAGTSIELNTPLTDLGLNNDNLYTVYDFWAGQYLGLIEKTLRVEVPPESVRLLGLRRFERRPMLVASSRHYSQGASDHTALDWAHETRMLSGAYAAVPGAPCTLSILVPEPYVTSTVTTTAELLAQKQTGTLLELTIRAPAGGEVQWRVNF